VAAGSPAVTRRVGPIRTITVGRKRRRGVPFLSDSGEDYRDAKAKGKAGVIDWPQ